MKTDRTDIYQTITDTIVKAIEAGANGCRLPWHDGGGVQPVNVVTRRAYRGINTVMLWAAKEDALYPSGEWGTYRQWQDIGAQVRKGETATQIVFWKALDDGQDDQSEEEQEKHRFVARAYRVFNAAQVDGYELPPRPQLPEVERLHKAEDFFHRTGADIRNGGHRAYYSPSLDYIQLPDWADFVDGFGYYSTLAHEITHWTGHKARCDRDLRNRFASQAYAAEELVAELGAAFLCADLNVTNHPRRDHADYLASWLKILRGDNRAIFTAAAKAQQAADWLHNHVGGTA